MENTDKKFEEVQIGEHIYYIDDTDKNDMKLFRYNKKYKMKVTLKFNGKSNNFDQMIYDLI